MIVEFSDHTHYFDHDEHVQSNALNSLKLDIFKIIDGRIPFYFNNLDLLSPKNKSEPIFYGD